MAANWRGLEGVLAGKSWCCCRGLLVRKEAGPLLALEVRDGLDQQERVVEEADLDRKLGNAARTESWLQGTQGKQWPPGDRIELHKDQSAAHGQGKQSGCRAAFSDSAMLI